MRTYGYNDPELVNPPSRWTWKHTVSLILALTFIIGIWFALNQKLIFGEDWLSATYDNEDWRTNEGNLHTYGAWDLEAHVWKTEYIMQNFPNWQWNPYWYLGMPLLKYYQSGFYIATITAVFITGLSAAKSATLLILFAHLVATLLTFLLCYKVSRRIWVAALCASFLLTNTFVSLRSYGWEPITVVFLFLYPLGLLLFLKEPLKPFRFWLIFVLSISYICHPLIFFSLCMSMGLYLFAIAIRGGEHKDRDVYGHFIWKYLGLVFVALLIGAVQFFPQMSYQQVTSGSHMGVKYLPFYQVPPNIITLKDFFFDAGNLKGPGPVIMIAFFLLLLLGFLEYYDTESAKRKNIFTHELIGGFTLVLVMMVLFYYLELYNIFPMNLLRSIQYHRIIPEFIIAAGVLVAALSNVASKHKRTLGIILYYTMLGAFVAASFIIVYSIQTHWQTTSDISGAQEFIKDTFEGRFSMPYTDQSLSVRNSFTHIPQVYGYYEQGITNSYNDEIFSVSSGYHNTNLTLLYLEAVNVKRLYVNMEEGERDALVFRKMSSVAPFIYTNGSRYGYFDLSLKDGDFAQAVSDSSVNKVLALEMGCRELFKEVYCGSRGEEFVSADPDEIKYLRSYVDMLNENYESEANFVMDDPQHYTINVENASENTSVIVKMTYDKDFSAYLDSEEIEVVKFGPDFMLIRPGRSGNYTINLVYSTSRVLVAGGVVSIISLIIVAIYFIFRQRIPKLHLRFKRGDL